jgi:Spy/CpxP family protein refolding chaperone
MSKAVITLPALALTATLGLTLAAQAQPTTPAGPPQQQQQHGWDREGMRARMQARMDQRFQVFHDALGLRADQEAAWQTFKTEWRPAGDRMGRRRDEDRDAAPMTTPERLERMAQRMSERQAAMARRAEAVKRFYAVLDERQRKTFDALVSLRMARFDRGGPGRRFGR